MPFHVKTLKKTREFWCLANWHLFFSSSSFALFVLDLVWTLVWLEKIKCSRGAGRYGGGTARRGAAWTFNLFQLFYLIQYKEKKGPFFKDPNFWYCFRFLDVSMIISIDLDAKPYLRFWNFALTSKTSSNQCFDRFPSEFSRIWAPLQQNCTSGEKVQICCSGAQILGNLLGNLSKHRFDNVFEVSAKFQYRR